MLAEIFGGYSAPFPSNPGSYVALAADEYGTLIEVYPLGTEMVPGTDDKPIQYQTNSSPSRFTATHAAISVQLSVEEISQIADRSGWRVLRCSRGNFDVIEFWIENSVLLELVTPEMARQYTTALAPEKIAEFLAQKNPSI